MTLVTLPLPIEHVTPRIILPDAAPKVRAIGAFVGVGVNENVLVHNCWLANRFVIDPNTVG